MVPKFLGQLWFLNRLIRVDHMYFFFISFNYLRWYLILLRASASVCANFLSILQEKTYLFYFTHPLLQNTYISSSILHIYLIKYSFFLHFLLFPSLSSSPSKPTTSSSSSTPTPSQQPFNKIWPLIHRSSTTTMIHRSSITTKSSHWFTDLLQQQSQQQRHNHNHNNSDPLALHVRSILHHRLRFQTDCWIREADRRSQLTRRPNSSIELSSWHARSPPSYRRLRLWSLRFWRRRRS